jgi:hypothetical protein
MVRSYTGSVKEVFTHIGSDRDSISSLAFVFDEIKGWHNPDESDYRSAIKEMPYIEARADGQLYGNRIQHEAYVHNVVIEMFSHDIRRSNRLVDLANLYKRLKSAEEIPGAVLHLIILKMLWLASGRGKLTIAA